SKVGGRVERVVINEGDLLQADQPLVYLEAPELKAQLRQTEARLQAAQADLERARNGPRNEEKDASQAAAAAAEARWQRLKAGFRVEEIEEAQADLASAEAERIGAQREFERVRRLRIERVVNQAEYDSAETTFNRLRAREEVARAKLKLYQAGSRVEEID